MSRVVHFEVPSINSEASRKFYEAVFGWKFTKYEGPVEYWLISTGAPGTPGIDGGFGGAANEFKATVNTVDVDDVDEAIKKVLANGGQVIMPKDNIPGIGWLAYVREPGGTPLGMLQADPNSRM
jgi:predicted enzyme related to lactoylglutathione lyase